MPHPTLPFLLRIHVAVSATGSGCWSCNRQWIFFCSFVCVCVAFSINKIAHRSLLTCKRFSASMQASRASVYFSGRMQCPFSIRAMPPGPLRCRWHFEIREKQRRRDKRYSVHIDCSSHTIWFYIFLPSVVARMLCSICATKSELILHMIYYQHRYEQ